MQHPDTSDDNFKYEVAFLSGWTHLYFTRLSCVHTFKKKKKKIQWNKERITLWQALSQPEESLFICW